MQNVVLVAADLLSFNGNTLNVSFSFRTLLPTPRDCIYGNISLESHSNEA